KKEESFFRSAFQKLKRIERPEKDKQKVPRDRSKLIAVTLWSCVGSLLFICLLAVLLSINTRSQLNDMKDETNKPTNDDKQKISVTAAENFLSG
ncbi:conjugal transfer protein, partial [Xanthomonas citri pv. citri]|nr:conjugal transfer protein [Xanthomonas citri pv. citri]